MISRSAWSPTGLLAASGAALCLSAGAAHAQVRVGGAEFPHIATAVAHARSGDTILVGPGHYAERLYLDRALTLVGEGRPVIDGGGEGHVIQAVAPVTIRGFLIRGSGSRVDREDAAVMVVGAPVVIEDNHIEDVFYGVYLKDASGSQVRANRITGKPLPVPRRGDGIRLWHSSRSLLEANEVIGMRDVVIYFSDSLEVRDNLVRDGRYGLHSMYSDHNRFIGNRFIANHVGAFIMYSKDVELAQNLFAEAKGVTGIGLGLKDADRIRATDNMFAQNAVGIHLDNSPSDPAAANDFSNNLVLANHVGVRLMPAVTGNELAGNAIVGNAIPVAIAGGVRAGVTNQNRWAGNYWDGYAGLDEDRDGIGDTPFRHARLTDDLLMRHDRLRVFAGSPALRLVDALNQFFPLLAPEPVVVDSAPAIAASALERWRDAPPIPAERPAVSGSRAAALAWGGASVLALAALTGLPRRKTR